MNPSVLFVDDEIHNSKHIPNGFEAIEIIKVLGVLSRFLKEKKKEEVKEYISYLFNRYRDQNKGMNQNCAFELFFAIYFIVKHYCFQDISDEHPKQSIIANEININGIATGFHSLEQMVSWLHQYVEYMFEQVSSQQDISGKEIVDYAKKYIQNSYGSDISLNKISEKYHINFVYFSRIFKNHTGESFNKYVTRIRMKEARNLLVTSSLKLHEVSQIVGYEDPKYFSKVFKKFFGVNPSSYSKEQPPISLKSALL